MNPKPTSPATTTARTTLSIGDPDTPYLRAPIPLIQRACRARAAVVIYGSLDLATTAVSGDLSFLYPGSKSADNRQKIDAWYRRGQGTLVVPAPGAFGDQPRSDHLANWLDPLTDPRLGHETLVVLEQPPPQIRRTGGTEWIRRVATTHRVVLCAETIPSPDLIPLFEDLYAFRISDPATARLVAFSLGVPPERLASIEKDLGYFKHGHEPPLDIHDKRTRPDGRKPKRTH